MRIEDIQAFVGPQKESEKDLFKERDFDCATESPRAAKVSGLPASAQLAGPCSKTQ